MQQAKSYKICTVGRRPNFDSLPVAKIIHYPLERRDYKPFAQCILCVGEGLLHLRMWAFEVSPMPTSALACALYCFPAAPEQALFLRLEHGEGDLVTAEVRLLQGGQLQPPTPAATAAQHRLELHPHNGEDLQGVYWGRTLSLPLDAVRTLGGELALSPGARLPGNFYKTCEDQRFAHQGSLFPAAFPQAPYALQSMGEFEVVAY